MTELERQLTKALRELSGQYEREQKQQAERVEDLRQQMRRLEEAVKDLQPQLGRTAELAEDMQRQVKLLAKDYRDIATLLSRG